MKRKSFNPALVPAAISLESVHVAAPCHADWNKMRGDDRSRFCPSCAKNVYNLSAMTSIEAQGLLQEKEGNLCVRFFQREDGTMLTQNCPVGVAALKERSPSWGLWAGVASLMLLAGALLSPAFVSGAQAQPEPEATVGETRAQIATPTPAEEPSSPAVIGDVGPALRPTVAPPTAAPTPTALPHTMGKIMMPRATPAPKPEVKVDAATATPKATPHGRPMVMGRMAMRPTPVPTPAAPEAMTGFVSSAPHPHLKPQSKAKPKRKPSSRKRS